MVMNTLGGTVAEHRAVPARQRLEADDAVAGQVDQRLVVNLDLIGRDGRAQFALDGRAPLDMGVHRRLEEAGERAAFGLGAVKREVGAAHQVVGRDAIVGRDCNADADAEHGLATSDDERLGDRAR